MKQEKILFASSPTIYLPSKARKTEASENSVIEPAPKWCTKEQPAAVPRVNKSILKDPISSETNSCSKHRHPRTDQITEEDAGQTTLAEAYQQFLNEMKLKGDSKSFVTKSY